MFLRHFYYQKQPPPPLPIILFIWLLLTETEKGERATVNEKRGPGTWKVGAIQRIGK